MVRIRADLVFGVDYAGISGGHCKLSKEALWGLEPAIFPARYGARFVGDPRAPVDSESLLRFDIETESVRKRDPMATHRMTVTLTGRFEGRAVTDPRDLTPAKLIGFGARGEMRAQLVITAVSDINFVGNISAGGREP